MVTFKEKTFIGAVLSACIVILALMQPNHLEPVDACGAWQSWWEEGYCHKVQGWCRPKIPECPDSAPADSWRDAFGAGVRARLDDLGY